MLGCWDPLYSVGAVVGPVILAACIWGEGNGPLSFWQPVGRGYAPGLVLLILCERCTYGIAATWSREGHGFCFPLSLWLTCSQGFLEVMARKGTRMAAKKAKNAPKLTPLGDRVLVERLEAEAVTAGGIVLPDSAKEKPIQGRVVAVGQGRRKEDGTVVALELKVGDRILFGKYGGTDVKLDGEEYLIMKEDDVLALIEE